MATKGQLEYLLELHELEQSLKKKKGKEKKTVETRIDTVSAKIDPWVLKHYRRLKIPFGEFRDRTCWGCGMIYPETHIHCRPSSGDIRLCESCGKILLLIDREIECEKTPKTSKAKKASKKLKAPKKAKRAKATSN
jgi:predicted  nucleic acid-binding Zn-ribbon protein